MNSVTVTPDRLSREEPWGSVERARFWPPGQQQSSPDWRARPHEVSSEARHYGAQPARRRAPAERRDARIDAIKTLSKPSLAPTRPMPSAAIASARPTN